VFFLPNSLLICICEIFSWSLLTCWSYMIELAFSGQPCFILLSCLPTQLWLHSSNSMWGQWSPWCPCHHAGYTLPCNSICHFSLTVMDICWTSELCIDCLGLSEIKLEELVGCLRCLNCQPASLLSLPFSSGNVIETQDTGLSVMACPNHGQITLCICTPTVSSWWSHQGLIAAGHCYL
jgi:hypothetical protein